jgi:hypothetical protein
VCCQLSGLSPNETYGKNHIVADDTKNDVTDR